MNHTWKDTEEIDALFGNGNENWVKLKDKAGNKHFTVQFKNVFIP